MTYTLYCQKVLQLFVSLGGLRMKAQDLFSACSIIRWHPKPRLRRDTCRSKRAKDDPAWVHLALTWPLGHDHESNISHIHTSHPVMSAWSFRLYSSHAPGELQPRVSQLSKASPEGPLLFPLRRHHGPQLLPPLPERRGLTFRGAALDRLRPALVEGLVRIESVNHQGSRAKLIENRGNSKIKCDQKDTYGDEKAE